MYKNGNPRLRGPSSCEDFARAALGATPLEDLRVHPVQFGQRPCEADNNIFTRKGAHDQLPLQEVVRLEDLSSEQKTRARSVKPVDEAERVLCVMPQSARHF